MHIVLIDDDSTSIFLMRLLLEREEFADTITSFQSPEEALHFLRSNAPKSSPCVVLLDLNMPLMSGWELLEALRVEGHEQVGHCRIYVLTSSLAQSDKLLAEHNPLVTRLIHKPLDSSALAVIKAEAQEYL